MAVNYFCKKVIRRLVTMLSRPVKAMKILEKNLFYCFILSEFIHVDLQKQPPEVFFKKAAPKNFIIFTEEHLFWSLFLIKTCNFINKRLQHRCFPVNIAKLLRLPILKNICKRLLLLFSAKTIARCSYILNLRNTRSLI